MLKKKKICRFCEDGILHIDYRDDKKLTRFVTDQGKIIPRRTSGSCASHQRMIKRAIKRARHLAFMPFVAEMHK